MSPIVRTEPGSAALYDRIARATDGINIDNAAERRIDE